MTIQSRPFVAFVKGEYHEINAREEIIAHIMNKNGIGRNMAISAIFDAGYEVFAQEIKGEEKELWGLAKLEVAARRAWGRQKQISAAAQAVGEEAVLEEATRMGMDEDEARDLIERSVDAVEKDGKTSKTRKMQQWLDGYLESNGPTAIDDVKIAAVNAGIVSDDIFLREADWNLMGQVASQYRYRGEERGVWKKTS